MLGAEGVGLLRLLPASWRLPLDMLSKSARELSVRGRESATHKVAKRERL